ncbi:MAG: UrcA family protein [Alphaproteobacteria bacterium]|nr:UrcA family protein [Alphaproteobacteria bacterium]
MKNVLSITSTFAAGLAFCFAIGSSLLSPPAIAQTPDKDAGFAFPFRYSSNELATPEGARHVVARLEHRVRTYCGDYGRMPADARAKVAACVDATMKASVAKFGSETLAQAYESRTSG